MKYKENTKCKNHQISSRHLHSVFGPEVVDLWWVRVVCAPQHCVINHPPPGKRSPPVLCFSASATLFLPDCPSICDSSPPSRHCFQAPPTGTSTEVYSEPSTSTTNKVESFWSWTWRHPLKTDWTVNHAALAHLGRLVKPRVTNANFNFNFGQLKVCSLTGLLHSILIWYVLLKVTQILYFLCLVTLQGLWTHFPSLCILTTFPTPSRPISFSESLMFADGFTL